MKVKLVDNWRNSWKWFSMQCMAASGALQGAWLAIPESMKATVPPEWVSYATVALLFLGVFGRLVSQSPQQ
jgi:hypothetical protein